MNKYRVLLNGRNFLLEMGDRVASHGLYTTRFVEANTPDEAELKAVNSIRNAKI